MNIRKFLLICLITIVVYRTGTYIFIYFYGSTALWHQIYTDNWNHYQLGAVILLLSIFGTRAGIKGHSRDILAGIGTGMIIDEISDVVKLFRLVSLPENFRDSLPDLILITVTYIIFALAALSWDKIRRTTPRFPQNHSRRK